MKSFELILRDRKLAGYWDVIADHNGWPEKDMLFSAAASNPVLLNVPDHYLDVIGSMREYVFERAWLEFTPRGNEDHLEDTTFLLSYYDVLPKKIQKLTENKVNNLLKTFY